MGYLMTTKNYTSHYMPEWKCLLYIELPNNTVKQKSKKSLMVTEDLSKNSNFKNIILVLFISPPSFPLCISPPTFPV